MASARWRRICAGRSPDRSRRYRSYRPEDNSCQPYSAGPRRRRPSTVSSRSCKCPLSTIISLRAFTASPLCRAMNLSAMA
ncbi:MAG: hypothetical protein E5W09_10095 [Mesorhizobium sp.]|nr:MAG: hypothetical protein E5W09_10095 [Mesorhizobium sp.]